MRKTQKFATLALTLSLVSAPLLWGQTSAGSQTTQGTQNGAAPITTTSAENKTAATPNWTTDQLLTSTVHQAWLLSNRNEATFFEMVSQLAQISARNRNLELPETAEAGRQVGEMIKTAAKQDTDQLLYAVVDAAVRKVGTPLAGTSGTTSPSTH